MKHNCSYCNYSTNRKDNFLKHNQTIKHKKNSNDHDTIICDICSSLFNSKTSLYRHYKECKENYEKKKLDECIITAVNTSVKNAVNEMKNVLDDKLKEHSKPQTIYNTITNNNIILSYVDTDISHIHQNDYKKIVNAVNFCVKMLVWKKHFNIEKPENMNLCISNKKDSYMKVFMKNKWISRKIDEMISTLFEENEMQIEDWLKELNDKGLNDKYNRYTKNKENKGLLLELQGDLRQFMYDMTKELGIGKNKCL
jgi:hypothetical protein